jgi:hypothetical protein
MNENIVEVTVTFFAYYDELSKEIRKKFKKQLTYLSHNPKHKSLQIHQIEGSEFWESTPINGIVASLKEEATDMSFILSGPTR